MGTTFKKERFGAYVRLMVILCAAISAMTAVELTIFFLGRGVSLWGPHLIFIIFNSLLAVLASSVVLRRFLEDKKRFQDLIERTSDWIWEVDEEGRYTYASPRIRDLLGYEPEEVLHKTPFDLMRPEEAKRTREIFATVIARRGPLNSFENANLHKDGRLVVLETSGLPFFDSAGKFRGYRGIDRDITGRKKIEQDRERLITELKESIANVKTLSGMLPICADCKKIRSDKGYWEEVASYITKHSDVLFSHGLCPVCAEKAMKELEEFKRKSVL